MLRDSRRRALVVVAHPDDETIFFGGLIQDLAASRVAVDIACVTGKFATDEITRVRRAEFQCASRLLQARAIQLEFHDRPGPLNVQELAEVLRLRAPENAYDTIYTHGAWGEYGHRHHSDVCLAVHHAFQKQVVSLAGPLLPSFKVLSHLPTKRRITDLAYRSQPFASKWCSGEECFVRLSLAEVEFIAKIIDAAAAPPARVRVREGPHKRRFRELVQRSREKFDRAAVPFPDIANIPSEIWSPVHAIRNQVLGEFLGTMDRDRAQISRSISRNIPNGLDTCRRTTRRGGKRKP